MGLLLPRFAVLHRAVVEKSPFSAIIACMKIFSTCEKDTFDLGCSLAKDARPGDIFCLEGDLGAGKTVFAKGFGWGLGISEPISSPTFTILHEYHDGRLPLYHFDAYRIDDPGEFYEIGYDEYFYGDGVCLIEWPSKVEELIPESAVRVRIERESEKGEDCRIISVER